MSRIRSIHPTQWTDEQFVSCSALARLLSVAIRNEADDRGIFEWKPLTIKMRLLPADNCDVSELLSELIDSDQITKFEADGKSYGLIRNFMQFQRPKKPVYRYPVPPEFPTSAEPVPQKAEIPPQMEEEGEGVEKEEEPPLPSEAPPLSTRNGFRLPNDWRPDSALMAWTTTSGFPAGRVPVEIERFCDYWTSQAGARSRRTDWDATWRNWIRKALEQNIGTGPPAKVDYSKEVTDWLNGHPQDTSECLIPMEALPLAK